MNKTIKKIMTVLICSAICLMGFGMPAKANTINGGTYEFSTSIATGRKTFTAYSTTTNSKNTNVTSVAKYETVFGNTSTTYSVSGTKTSSYILNQALPNGGVKWLNVASDHISGTHTGETSA